MYRRPIRPRQGLVVRYPCWKRDNQSMRVAGVTGATQLSRKPRLEAVMPAWAADKAMTVFCSDTLVIVPIALGLRVVMGRGGPRRATPTRYRGLR